MARSYLYEVQNLHSTEYIELDLIALQEMKRDHGNCEIGLFLDEAGEWTLMLGNPCSSVNIGECGGEINVSGETFNDVVKKAKAELLKLKSN